MIAQLVTLALGAAPPPCGFKLDFATVPPAYSPPVESKSAGRGLGSGDVNSDTFVGVVGSTLVVVGGDEVVTGSAINLAQPSAWRAVPPLNRGKWGETGGVADLFVPAGGRLVAAWWRSRNPIRVAVYDPGQNTWRMTKPPAKAAYASNTALQDWWLTWLEAGGYRLDLRTLQWKPIRAPPAQDFDASLVATVGNRAFFPGAGERKALGGEEGFAYEQLWRKRLLVWGATSSRDFNSPGLPWTAERTEVRVEPRGGVVTW